jgi:hypothetical protein
MFTGSVKRIDLMSKVNLAKALKMKNSLIGEINRLKTIFLRENSRQSASKSTVDRQKVYSAIEDKVAILVGLKSKITAANISIYPVLCAMEEAKSRMAWLPTIPVKHGLFQEGYGAAQNVIQWDAYITQDAIDEETRLLQKYIEELQDKVDAYNATTTIEA